MLVLHFAASFDDKIGFGLVSNGIHFCQKFPGPRFWLTKMKKIIEIKKFNTNHIFSSLGHFSSFQNASKSFKKFLRANSGIRISSKFVPKSALGNDFQRAVHNFRRPECSRTFVRSTFECNPPHLSASHPHLRPSSWTPSSPQSCGQETL